jgi:hypothetical protein
MKTLIPKELIDRAEKAEACKEAIDWLREKPRTWLELTKGHRDWGQWALDYMCTILARITYYKAIEKARSVYMEISNHASLTHGVAINSACRIYDQITMKAWKDYIKAMRLLKKAFTGATGLAKIVHKESAESLGRQYDKTKALARKAYKKAEAEAWRAHKKAISPAENAYCKIKARALKIALLGGGEK